MQVIFTGKDKQNVLTVDALQAAHKIYRQFMNMPGYSSYCSMRDVSDNSRIESDPSTWCYPPDSLFPYLFSSLASDTIPDLKRGLLLAIKNRIYDFTDASFSESNLQSGNFRVQFSWGAPLPGYESASDRFDEQKLKLLGFLKECQPFFDHANSNKSLPFTVHYGGDIVTDYEIQKTIYRDAMFAIGSLVVILLLMRVHMGSFFLAFAGLLLISISFPSTYFVYRVIFGIRYVGVLNAISLFLITGVGVDDVFVFYDVFCQFRQSMPVQEKLMNTFGKAAKATFITSATTAAAFVTNTFSAIPALQLFGVYMVIIVSMNWILVMTIFPIVLVVWDTRLRNTNWCKCLKLPSWCNQSAKRYALLRSTILSEQDEVLEVNDPTQVEQELNLLASTEDATKLEIDSTANRDGLEDSGGVDDVDKGLLTQGSVGKGAKGDVDAVVAIKQRPVVKFFANKVSPFLFKYRFLFLFLFGVMVGLGGWQASAMRPSSEPPSFFPAGSNIQWFLDWQTYAKPSSGYGYFDSSMIIGCDGIPMSEGGQAYDQCNVCGGNNACVGCDGVPNSNKAKDICGVCGGDSSSCTTTSTTGQATTGKYSSATSSVTTTSTIGSTASMSTTGKPMPTPTPTPPITPAPATPAPPITPKPTTTATGPTTTTTGPTTATTSTGTVSTTGPATPKPSTPSPSTPAPITPAPTTPAPTTPAPTTSTTGSCVLDQCGVCNGDSSSCRSGCDNMPNSKKKMDECNVCGGDSKSCEGCDGVPNSGVQDDVCGVCGGNNACVPQKPVFTNNNIQVAIVWGLTGIDRSKADINDPFSEYVGEPLYYQGFNPATPEAMQYITTSMQRLIDPSDPLLGSNAALVVVSSALLEFQRSNPNVLSQRPDAIAAAFGAWAMQNGKIYDVGVRVEDGKYKFLWLRMAFRINVTTDISSFEGIKVFDAWEKALRKLSVDAPQSLGPVYQSSDTWLRVVTEVAAVKNIITGLAVSTSIAVLAAFMFTHNVIIAALVLVVLVGIVISCIALFQIVGWKLGVIEAISITVLVGLSVDYCLHLAEVFAHSKAKSGNRYDRTRDALAEMGISVVGGALTTIGSSIMLLFCTIQIFAKFGIIVTANTAFSIVLTIFVFCPLLMVAGPQHDQGNVVKFFKKMFSHGN